MKKGLHVITEEGEDSSKSFEISENDIQISLPSYPKSQYLIEIENR